MKNKFVLFDSDSLKSIHKRIFFSIFVFIFIYFVGIYRISEIMLTSEIKIANNLFNEKEKRGKIFDRNGVLLASTILSNSLSVNPIKIKNKKNLSIQLSKIFNINQDKIYNKLLLKNEFVWIKRNITPLEHQKIIDLGEINLRIHKENKRIYPYQNASSHIVGYVDIDQNGLGGIERGLNHKLKKSKDIFLTIDINLQQRVRSHLINTFEKYRADAGIALVMDINSGELLSSVSYPDFNPNDNLSYNKMNLINRVIQSNYEMGSTFKPLTVAMGYDKDLINPKMTFDVSKKYRGIKDYLDYEGNGIYDVEKIIVKSSNIGTAQIASIIGKKNQIDFFKKVGFYNKVKLEILESAEPLGNKNNWGDIETMTIGYGHGFAITPIHLVKAYATIANKGYIINPTLLLNKKITMKENILLKEETSKYFLEILSSVINKTKVAGPKVKIDGYNIGGKTGTATIVKETGGYYEDRDITSFIGIFPVNEPKYVVLTMLEYPKKIEGTKQKTTGGTVNAPLVKDIIIEMIKILRIPKYLNTDFLKADTKYLYLEKNVTL